MSEYNITIVLVFEPSTILNHQEKDWSQYHRLGETYLPQIALTELEFLTNRAVLPEEEKAAREFMRFFPNSHWQIHKGLSSHQTFVRAEGENLSKKARLQYCIAQSVYDLSLQLPLKLIILVTNNQNLRTNLAQTQTQNLITLTLAQFNLWLRTQQKPTVVIETIEQLTNSNLNPTTQSINPSIEMVAKPQKNQILKTSNKTVTKQKIKKVTANQFNLIPNFISGILALGALFLVGILIWFLTEPESFEQFLEQNQWSHLENKI